MHHVQHSVLDSHGCGFQITMLNKTTVVSHNTNMHNHQQRTVLYCTALSLVVSIDTRSLSYSMCSSLTSLLPSIFGVPPYPPLPLLSLQRRPLLVGVSEPRRRSVLPSMNSRLSLTTAPLFLSILLCTMLSSGMATNPLFGCTPGLMEAVRSSAC
jgi:hypothetical protein